MKIKGTTKIELTNVKTGKKEVYTHENFVTEFASEYFKECGALNTDPLGSLQNTRPIDDLFGGIMLFNKKIDQNTDSTGNHSHPLYCPAGTKMIANSAIDFTENSNATELGQYNSEESGTPNEHQRVYVYDWGTNEGNGKINCVCLTSRAGGYIGAGNTTSGVRDNTQSANLRRVFQYKGTVPSVRRYLASNDKTKLAGLNLSTSRLALLSDTPKNCFTAGSVTVNWYDVPVSKLQPFVSKISFDSSVLTPHADAAKSITQRSVNYARVMGGTGYILLVGCASSSLGNGAVVYAAQLNKDGTVTNKAYTLSANSGIDLSHEFIGGKVIGNDLYLASSGYGSAVNRARIKGDGSVVNLSVSGDNECIFFENEGRVYRGTRTYYDTQSGESYVTNASQWQDNVYNQGLWQCYDSNLCWCINESSTNLTPYVMSVLRPPCNWLSTINNLSQEIEKTAEKTMKVTYTLTLGQS